MSASTRYSDLKSLLALIGETATFAFAGDKVDDPNYRNPAGETPLSVAITWQDLAAVKLLVAGGADVNARMWHGETPLHGAASRGTAGIVKYLLEHGASPDATDDMGLSPRDIAALSRDPEIVGLLGKF